MRPLGRIGALLALAASGIFASVQAAAHEQGLAELTSATECAGAVRVGHDVAYEPRLGGYAVVGVELVSFPDECLGAQVRVVVLDDAGTALADVPLELVAGNAAALAPLDARTVGRVQVRPR